MIKQIIPAFPQFKKQEPIENFLRVSEFFCDTIQGEGINIGHPATFLRLQGCSISCSFCDSKEVWKQGNPFTFGELFEYLVLNSLPVKLLNGQHLVLTGGSPLLQQQALMEFIHTFELRCGFVPYIEIENECTILPVQGLIYYISCWNNSPKLANSGVPFEKRIKPHILKLLSNLKNSWFKFVISGTDDWNEINEVFLLPKLIKKNQIILMPEGCSREEIRNHSEIALEMAVRHGVRYSDRLHIHLWDRAVGV